MEFKEQARQHLRLENYVSRFVSLKKNGKNFIGCCPFHSEKTPSFNINAVDQYYHCFGCKASGDIYRFIMDYHKVDFPGALEIASEETGIPLKEKDPAQDKLKEDAYRVNGKALAFFQKNLHDQTGIKAIQYLKDRGITAEEIERFGLGYAPNGFQIFKDFIGEDNETALSLGLLKNNEGSIYDFYRDRIMFPIRDYSSRVLGFSGRSIADDGSAKYINSPNSIVYDKGNSFYNLDLSREKIKETKSVFLVEGVLDVLGMARMGFQNVLAPLGTAFTEKQARFIKSRCETVHVFMDDDEAGNTATFKIVETLLKLSVNVSVVLGIPGEKGDPFELSMVARKSTEFLMKDGWSYLIEKLIGDVTKNSPIQDKRNLLGKISEYVQSWDKQTDREIILSEISTVININTRPNIQEPTPIIIRSETSELIQCEYAILSKCLTDDLIPSMDALETVVFTRDEHATLFELIASKRLSGESFHVTEILSSNDFSSECRVHLLEQIESPHKFSLQGLCILHQILALDNSMNQMLKSAIQKAS